ncbi:PREDICTED: ribosomal RNA-processing protein 8 [Nicrophorus vespilloides]|uniref:Ribosomal RNA-processing protein 8 n=1 Tax=Nicrophorus vespilloides TaxID=110193 RepID=A0ABM1MNF2_NICVS|nr:PREDICTED: ribosomal RNA-processing protein 8 [Nicrophorus vespilloides]
MKVKKPKVANNKVGEENQALVKVKSKKAFNKLNKKSKVIEKPKEEYNVEKLQSELSAILSGSFGKKLNKCVEDINAAETVKVTKKKKLLKKTDGDDKKQEVSKSDSSVNTVKPNKKNKVVTQSIEVSENVKNEKLGNKIKKDKPQLKTAVQENETNVERKKFKKEKPVKNKNKASKEIKINKVELINEKLKSKKNKVNNIGNKNENRKLITDKEEDDSKDFKNVKKNKGHLSNKQKTNEKLDNESNNKKVKTELIEKKEEVKVEAEDTTTSSMFPHMENKKAKKKANLMHSNVDSNIDYKRNNVSEKSVDLAKILQDEKKLKLYNMLNEAKTKPVKLAGKRKMAKLPLRERMMEKLKAARFRYLNEQIYTTDGSEAKAMFQSDPAAFKAYHEGFSQQVNRWPINPVDVIIESIKKMSKNLVIADFGCGDAKIAKSVENTVHSFDLVASDDAVTACDMSNVPLENSSVDVAVFCLSLMGTNLQDYIKEANRVLKMGGILKIAEVESRFDKVETFISGISHFGFKKTWNNLANDIFFFIDFKKTANVKGKQLPTVSLKPCLYKKR